MVKAQRGFTAVEILLVVALLAIIAGISAPFLFSFQQRNDVEVGAQNVALSLNNAQVYARGMISDQTWSVHIANGAVTTFPGTDFATRNPSNDHTVTLASTITVSGTQDFSFARFTGLPNQTGTITLTTKNNSVRTISINAQGLVQIQ